MDVKVLVSKSQIFNCREFTAIAINFKTKSLPAQ